MSNGNTGASDISAAQSVAEQVRTHIKYGRLAPAQRLIEADLVEELGVSRGTLRAALSQLASEGIITLERNRGARVRSLDLEDIRQLYELRATLEGRAAGLAAQRVQRPEDRELVMTLVADSKSIGRQGDFGQYWAHNEEVHGRILSYSGNSRLRTLADQTRSLTHHYHLQAQAASTEAAVKMQDSASDHRAILKLILEQKPTAAERLMRNHIENSSKSVIEILRGEGMS